MVTLAFLVAACLDPAQAALVLVVVLAYRGPQPVLVAGAAAALATETVMALAASGYVWGELIAPRLVAALLQAAALVVAVRIVRSAARGTGAALGFGRVAQGGASVTLEPPPPAPPPTAPWHMRSYAVRRISELQQKKHAALDCESQ
ncbi:MAG: hypothetical protein WAN86_27615 [Hyphomicrobiaceae bacterium]